MAACGRCLQPRGRWRTTKPLQQCWLWTTQAEQLKENSLVLFLCRNQSFNVLCNEGDILVVVCRRTWSVCVFLLQACECVFSSGGESSVWMVCRPCAGLWGVDCGVPNHGLLMLCLGIWRCCVPLCLRSLTVSLHLSCFCPRFPFLLFISFSTLSSFFPLDD